MRKIKHFLLLTAMLLCSFVCKAQFTATVEQYPRIDYSTTAAEFELSEIAKVLGTDTATLVAALDAWYYYDKESGAEKPADMFFLKVGEELVADYDYTPGYFWINRDGSVGTWGEGAVYYNQIWWDNESNADKFYIELGQFPDSLKAGATFTPTFVLQHGDKLATFDVTYTVKPLPAMPKTELEIAKLEIVGETETVVEQYPRGNYSSSVAYVNIAGVVDKLGIDAEVFEALIPAGLGFYRPYVDITTGFKVDSLTSAVTYGGWGRVVFDATTGKPLTEVCIAPWDAEGLYGMDSWVYNSKSDTLGCNIVQYPGKLKVGDTFYSYVYIVYGNKAYRIKYTLNIVEDPNSRALETMTKVGESVFRIEQQPNNNYATSAITLNTDSIAELLGCAVGDMSFLAIENNGVLSAESTAGNGGYWLTQDGFICSWGNDAYSFVEPATLNNYSQLNIGQMPYNTVVGEEAHALLYLTSGDKYYELDITLAIEGVRQLRTGDTFAYVDEEGVEKTYFVTGGNLIVNPSFDEGTDGWTGGAGGALTGVDWHSTGGVDGGAYIRPTEIAGMGSNGSIGTAWELEKGKTYVFSYFIRQNTNLSAVSKEGYIVTSETDTPRGVETKTIMYAHEDANCAWTQNLVVTTAEYKFLQFRARWLGGSKCFDSFILAEVMDMSELTEDAFAGTYGGNLTLTHLTGEENTLESQVVTISKDGDGKFNVTIPSFVIMPGTELGEFTVEDVTVTNTGDGSYSLIKEVFNIIGTQSDSAPMSFPNSALKGSVYADGTIEISIEVKQNSAMALTTATFIGKKSDVANSYLVLLNEKRADITNCISVLDSLGLTGMKLLLTTEYEKTNSIDVTSGESVRAEILRLQDLRMANQAGIDAYNELGTLITECDSLVSQQASANLSNSIAAAKAVFNNTATATAEDLMAAHKALGTARNLYRIENISTASFNFTTTATVGDWYLAFDNTNNVVRVNQYRGSKTDVIIPETFTYNGVEYVTVGLGDNYRVWQYNYGNVKSITLPATLRFLGDDAFYSCQSLSEISIPSSVESIGNYAFQYCRSLENMIIPDGVTSIGYYAFSGCSSLTSIIIPEGVTSIEDGAFFGCSGLISITLPESLASIGYEAFYDCDGLTSIIIPEGVTSIGYEAFYNCPSLTSIVVADGNSVYDSRNGCNAIIETSSNTLIQGCSATIIPVSVTSIGYYAFSGCSNLTSISIPASVTSIGYYAFSGCSNLTSIVVADGNPVYDSRNGCNAIIETSSNTLIQGCSATIIPESVTSIGPSAFSGCSSLTSISIPASVTLIGSSAFSGCSNLTSITIPKGVTSIKYSAFSDCSSLTSITIPDGVTSIEDQAFYNCRSLTSIIIPEGLTSIGWGAFLNTAWYDNQPDGVVYLGKVLLTYKGRMYENTSVEVKDGTKGIANYAFSDCYGLTSITLPESLASIGDEAFYGCELDTVFCYAITPPSISSYSLGRRFVGTVYVPSVSLDLYRSTYVWKNYMLQPLNFLFSSYEYGVGVTVVTLTPSVEGAKVYYTLDGRDPLVEGILYEEPFEVDKVCTLKAIAVSEDEGNSNLIDELIKVKNNPQISDFDFSYTDDVTYDGRSHGVYVYASAGMGAITVMYKDSTGVESPKAPSAVGRYDVSIHVAEGDYFHAASFDSVASFTISVMDEVEWKALLELYEKTDGANSWWGKWNVEGGIAAAASFYGIKYRKGHIVNLDLSRNNLVGELPVSILTLPYLEKLVLYNNRLSGKLDDIVAEAESTGNVSLINISDNDMRGNIGAIVTCCPNLEYLYAERNHFTDVIPVLPASLSVYLSGQMIDDILLWDGVVTMNNGTEGLPTILYYHHQTQSYINSEWSVHKAWDNNDWFMLMNVNATSGAPEISSVAYYGTGVFYGNSGDTLDVTASPSVTATNSKAKMVYRFKEGDANLSGATDVLDLQTTINFIFKEYQNYPFNHTAANLQAKDDVIDVLDVIALVDLLLSDTASVESLSQARARVNTFAADADAYLYWEDNRLILETTKDIAALDIALRGQATYQWNKALSMTVVCSEEDTHQRIISYSMSGKYIPQGKHVLLTATASCEIATALVADRAAQRVDVALKAPEHTGIEAVAPSQLHCRYHDGWLQLCADSVWEDMQWEVYATDGRLLAKGTLPYAESGVTNLWHTDTKSTVIVLVKDNNGIVLTQKINTIK